jgi:hypothetical protein
VEDEDHSNENPYRVESRRRVNDMYLHRAETGNNGGVEQLFRRDHVLELSYPLRLAVHKTNQIIVFARFLYLVGAVQDHFSLAVREASTAGNHQCPSGVQALCHTHPSFLDYTRSFVHERQILLALAAKCDHDRIQTVLATHELRDRPFNSRDGFLRNLDSVIQVNLKGSRLLPHVISKRSIATGLLQRLGGRYKALARASFCEAPESVLEGMARGREEHLPAPAALHFHFSESGRPADRTFCHWFGRSTREAPWPASGATSCTEA